MSVQGIQQRLSNLGYISPLHQVQNQHFGALAATGHDSFQSTKTYQPPEDASLLSKWALKAINGYQSKLSRNPDAPRLLKLHCAYNHLGKLSCSEYGKRAYENEQWGFLKATWMTAVRVSSCNPLMLWPKYRDAAIKHLGWVGNPSEIVSFFPKQSTTNTFSPQSMVA